MKGRLLLAGMLLAAVVAPASAAERPASSNPEGQSLVEVERTLLGEHLERYEQLSRRRGETLSRLTQLYRSLDDGVRATDAETPGKLSGLVDQIGRAEAERAALLDAERAVVEAIETQLRRVTLLTQRLSEARVPEEPAIVGTLTGAWDIVLMPLRQRGTLNLEQSGALVSGTYRLDGGWTGSLQGTLVNRKVFLVRIDSKLGKSMEFEGYLSGDAGQIRGSWLNYELAGSDGGTGQWNARRRPAPPNEP